MRERPILFSGPMVRAILEGRKTQTRRVLRPQPPEGTSMLGPEWFEPAIERWDGALVEGKPVFGAYDEDGEFGLRCPYGAPGDRLWVRETWRSESRNDGARMIRYAADQGLVRVADTEDRWHAGRTDRWRPSIYMPRWASRLLLEVTEVRVQRLQEISEEDAAAEGVPCWVCGGPTDGTSEADCECFHTKRSARGSFEMLWNEINGKRDGCEWAANPWVWCLSFRRAEVPRG